MTELRLQASEAALVVVDFQERLARAMPEPARQGAERQIATLLTAARRLGLPAIVTEQYPKGLGPTVEPIRQALEEHGGGQVVEKVEFDACANAGFVETLDGLGRRQAIVTGMEAHVCVWQTVQSLCARGLTVHVPVDATCSRDPDNRRIAEGLWRAAGGAVTTTETVLFDLLGRAGTDDFKAISKLVK